jgi:hypothetical protein
VLPISSRWENKAESHFKNPTGNYYFKLTNFSLFHGKLITESEKKKTNKVQKAFLF